MGRVVFVAFVLLCLGGCSRAAAPSLTEKVSALARSHAGKVALYAENLATHEQVTVNADEAVQAASVIKLSILYHVLLEVRAGRARWNERIALTKDDQVAGSGVLLFFDTPLSLTLHDVVSMMIDVSDNTATNLLIDRFGIEAINRDAEAIGLKNTHLHKKVFKPAAGVLPADYEKFGLGKTTPREMAALAVRIGTCRLGDGLRTDADKALCSEAIGILRHQFYRDAIPRYIEKVDSSEEGTAIANKTGALDAVRNDVALIGTRRGLVVISAFTYDNADRSWESDNAAEVCIAKMAQAIVNAWAPDGLSARALSGWEKVGKGKK
jgi:beta-lactamase class A